MLDMVVDRRKMRDELATVVRLLMNMPPRIHGDLPAPDETETGAEDAAPADSAP